MYYLESVRAVAKGMGNLLESCTLGQRKRLDTVSHHKKTDEHTPADKGEVDEKSLDSKSLDDDVKAQSEATKVDKKTEDTIVFELSESEAPKKEREHTSENGVHKPDTTESTQCDVIKSADIDVESHDQKDTESHDLSHDQTDASHTESHDHSSNEEPEDEIVEEVEIESPFENGLNDDLCDPSEEAGKRWSFPPILDQFDLMDTETDPDELEAIFADERLKEIYLEVTPDGPGLGISIVGGQGSPAGDLPIIIKRVLPGSLAEQDGRLKSGDELVAMNEKLLVGVSKDVAINSLSNLDGPIRLLVLQDE